MEMPAFPAITETALRAIAERHGLDPTELTRLPPIGITNAIYACGKDRVLRIPRDHPNLIATLRREAVAVPLARRAGVRTPRMVAFDDSCDLLPVPYTLYERVHGETLGLLEREPEETADAYRALGRDLARLHAGVSARDVSSDQRCALTPEHRPDPARLAEQGHFALLDARWLSGWLDRLEAASVGPIAPSFLHGDVQATNVLVRPGTHDYVAVPDWGNAGWGDVALDFVGIPLAAARYLLEGHREVAPLAGDATIEARILYYQLWFALEVLARPPQPGLSWAERPLGMLLQVTRFLMKKPEAPWDRWT